MDNQNNGKAVKLGISAVVIMSLIGTAGSMLPFAGILIYPAAILFFICSRKNGFIFTLPFLTAAYVFTGFGTSFITAISDVLAPGLAGLVMGELLRINRTQGESLLKGVLTGILCNLATVVCLKMVEGKSLLTELRKTVNSVINTAVEEEQMTLYAAQTMKQTYEVILQMIPAVLIITILLGTVFVYFSGCAIMKNMGDELPNYHPFREFSFSRNIIFGSLIMMIFGYIAGLTGIINTNVLLLNISAVIWVLFSLQGLATAIFLWNLSRFPKIVFIILTALLLMSLIGTVVLFLLGIADILINIRARVDIGRGQ
ncbi:MAG: DUF2232 domain-containing protein [Bacillota bacterium]|nr:DUF2232 domain-containing protein [Bacillota bacterium]